MNTTEIANGLSTILAAYSRLPVVEAELKSAIEDRDFTKLQVDEANETIAKLRGELEMMRLDADAAKIKIANLENQIVDLNNRNADLDDTANELIRQVRNLTIDIDASRQRCNILTADKEALTRELSNAKSFGSRLAEKLTDIGSLLRQVPEATNTAPFRVSEPMAMPDTSDAGDASALASDTIVYLDQTSGQDMVKTVDVPAEIIEPETDDNAIAAGCNVYRYW